MHIVYSHKNLFNKTYIETYSNNLISNEKLNKKFQVEGGDGTHDLSIQNPSKAKILCPTTVPSGHNKIYNKRSGNFRSDIVRISDRVVNLIDDPSSTRSPTLMSP